MPTWMNAGDANYHAMTVSLRRAFSQGVSFDFNYTLSHSIDNASAAEGSSGQDGAVIQNIFNPGEFRGSSDFDIRNQVNVDVVYELPVGKGKPFWSSAPGWANEMFRRLADFEHHAVLERPAQRHSGQLQPGTPTTGKALSRSPRRRSRREPKYDSQRQPESVLRAPTRRMISRTRIRGTSGLAHWSAWLAWSTSISASRNLSRCRGKATASSSARKPIMRLTT